MAVSYHLHSQLIILKLPLMKGVGPFSRPVTQQLPTSATRRTDGQNDPAEPGNEAKSGLGLLRRNPPR